MKIEFHIKEIVITSRQKAVIEKKLAKLKRYFKDEPSTIDVHLIDQTGGEKGGVDQTVHLNVVFGKEQIFIEESDDRLMRAFAYAYKKLERQLQEYHRAEVDKREGKAGPLKKVFGIFRRRK